MKEVMTMKKKELEQYLKDYQPTHSTEMDSVFIMCKSDVFQMSQRHHEGKVIIYSKEEFRDMVEEMIEQEEKSYEEDMFDLESIISIWQEEWEEFDVSGYDTVVEDGFMYYYV